MGASFYVVGDIFDWVVKGECARSINAVRVDFDDEWW
jgi:hypothetical protein